MSLLPHCLRFVSLTLLRTDVHEVRDFLRARARIALFIHAGDNSRITCGCTASCTRQLVSHFSLTIILT